MSKLLADKNKVGIIIARMQVPYLTESHKKVIKTVIDRHEKTYLLLGVDDRSDLNKNPFEYYFREQMITLTFRQEVNFDKTLVIIPLFDKKSDNKTWVNDLDIIIERLSHPKEATLYGGRDSFIDTYVSNEGKFKTQELSQEDYDSGTELRELESHKELTYSTEVARAILATLKLKK